MEMMLKTSGLSKRYGSFKALDNLNMHVEKGSVYGFVGQNGAGKTTLIRLICGLQEPTGGEYTLIGRKNSDAEIVKSRRKMGAIVETPSLYRHLSARENLHLQKRVLGLPDDNAAEELLDWVSLRDTGKKKVRDFSLGMRQRLAIAVALAGDPDFLVLDEPVNGLDPQGIIEIRELILKLNRQREVTVMISSHNLDELSRLATCYGFIRHGQMIKEISAADLEAACRKCIRASVNQIEAAAQILSDHQIEHTVHSDHEIDIFSSVTTTELVSLLGQRGCDVLSVHQQDESLESYYLSLIGGARHE